MLHHKIDSLLSSSEPTRTLSDNEVKEKAMEELGKQRGEFWATPLPKET
jgi:hypothetical protein